MVNKQRTRGKKAQETRVAKQQKGIMQEEIAVHKQHQPTQQ